MDIDLDTINFKSTIKSGVNCGWDSNLHPSNVVLLSHIKISIN